MRKYRYRERTVGVSPCEYPQKSPQSGKGELLALQR